MRYLSVCSGIEAASVAWEPLGWTPVGFSEIEPFPAAVLAHRFPNVPNYGDMTKHKEWPLEQGSIDLLVGGTPCQSFSVAGLRQGLSDPRGGLMLTYLEIAQRLRPRWLVWENVPGVLSSNGGRDFGSFLGALGDLGYGWAYRVLDAQWIRTQRHPRAVPQRRRRVFVVGCLGDWTAAAAVLFERESVRRDSAPRRAKGQGVAPDAEVRAGAECQDTVGALCAMDAKHIGSQYVNQGKCVVQPDAGQVSATIAARFGVSRNNYEECVVQPVASTLGNRGVRHTELDGHGAYIPQSVAIQGNLIGRDVGGPHGVGASDDGVMYTLTKADVHGVTQPVAFGIYGGNKRPDRPEGGFYAKQEDTARTLDAAQGLNPTCSQGGTAVTQPVPYDLFQITAPVNRQNRAPGDPCHTLARDNAAHAAVTQDMAVRRLTPRECERLQGFPDDWTLIPWRKKAAEDCPDGPRYRALGNSMAVNCMEWIGERIAKYSNPHPDVVQ